jgi:AcrR family transcriptional regulator
MNQPSTSPAALPRAPQTARGRRTRQQLLDGAEGVFGQKGFERASIADITQKAGVALGTFYVYFPDKTSIFIELVDELGSRLRRQIAAEVSGLDDRLEIERAGFRAFFKFAATHRELYKIVRQCEFVDDVAYRRYYSRLAAGYVRGLGKAMDTAQIRKLDPECLAYCLMGIADFLGMRFVLWNGEDGLERIVDQAMTFIAHGISTVPRGKKESR